jgi:hypothetical protein
VLSNAGTRATNIWTATNDAGFSGSDFQRAGWGFNALAFQALSGKQKERIKRRSLHLQASERSTSMGVGCSHAHRCNSWLVSEDCQSIIWNNRARVYK